MQEYVKELSKYAIAILMAVHTFCGFLSLSDRMEKSSAVHVLQNMLLFTIQFLMFINLGLAAKDMQYIFSMFSYRHFCWLPQSWSPLFMRK